MIAVKFNYEADNRNDFLLSRTKIYFNRNTNLSDINGRSYDYNNELCTYDHFSS